MSKFIARMIEQRRGLRTNAGWSATSAIPDMRHGAKNDFVLTPSDRAAGFYDRALSLAGIGVWQCDLQTEALTWTAGVFDIFGIPSQSKLDRRDIVEMYCEDSREAMERLRADAIAQQRGFSLDARIIRADGALRWMRLTASTASSDGRPAQLYGIKQDITADRERWEAMRRMAEHDALTGLASRSLFQSRFLDSARSAPTIAPLGALVLFDIDGFKQVNDQWGHAAGDACLEAVAARLSVGFPHALMAARIGGDEFAILTTIDRQLADLERIVEKQLACLAAPIFWQGKLLNISASAGIAAADDPFAYDAESLFAAADGALYSAKQAGRNRFQTAGTPGAASNQRYFCEDDARLAVRF